MSTQVSRPGQGQSSVKDNQSPGQWLGFALSVLYGFTA